MNGISETRTTTKQTVVKKVKPKLDKEQQRKSVPEKPCARNLTWPENSDRWQIVDNMNNSFVFSAFAEPDEHRVKIMGLHRVNLKSSKRCICWFYKEANEPENIQTNGTIDLLTDHHGTTYGAMMITCDLNDNEVWHAVSVTPSIKHKPLNRMILHYPAKAVQRNFTLCLSVMHSRLGNVLKFVEAVEFDKVLGANHFIIHHLSSSQPMKILLNDYIKTGEVTLLNYNLPIGTKDVHYFGQIAAVNDCVYRSRGVSRYVFVVDIDEILIPYAFNDWMEMMDNLTSAEPKASSFSFRTTFFDTTMPDDTRRYRQKDLATRYKLTTLLKVWRENYIFERNVRCKVIGKPELIDVMAIHTVANQKRAHKLIPVNYTTALLHHYRLKNSSPTRIYNDKTRQYSSRVVDRVIKRVNSIPTPCIRV
ncbi:hypothetical protein SNE40_000259 [Patella caerulea]